MPRNNNGKAIQATINDSKITPAAIKISSSRSGKSSPSLSNKGIDITPASVTAPRTPPTVRIQQERAVGTIVSSCLPRQRRNKPDKRQMLCTQIKRSAIKTRKITTTSRMRYISVGQRWVSSLTTALMMSGSCSPNSKKISPLNANSNKPQTLRFSKRVLV